MIEKTILKQIREPLLNKRKYGIIVFCTLCGLSSSLAYTNLAANFGGISIQQFYGFIFSITASIMQLIVGILSCLYFARNDTTYRFPISMMTVMGIELAFCIASIVLFIIYPLPNKLEMKDFVITNENGKFSPAQSILEQELRCCGVDSYENYKYSTRDKFSWKVPISCCDYQSQSLTTTNCADPQNISYVPPDFTMGCFTKISRIEDTATLAPSFWLLLNVCRFLVVGLFTSSIIFMATLYLYFKILYKIDTLYANKTPSSIHSQHEAEEEPEPSTSSSSIPSSIKFNQTNATPENSTPILPSNNNNAIVSPDSPKLNKFKINFEKINEISIEQLPGSLSQLSSYIYSSHELGATMTNLRPNKFI